MSAAKPNRIVNWSVTAGGEIEARLDQGGVVLADQIILATGYRVELSKVPYLAEEVDSGRLKVDNGYPVLGDDFQTSLQGLYIAGQAATRDFGPCFGFVRGCIAAARIIVSGMLGG